MSKPVEINESWCKGCVICVEFCPTDVLEMREGKAVAVRPEDCIGCMQCEIHCPDLAIKIHKEFVTRKKKSDADESGSK
jgi:2-oxoglutarate ferredoxin oxidoreductase subunit delta